MNYLQLYHCFTNLHEARFKTRFLLANVICYFLFCSLVLVRITSCLYPPHKHNLIISFFIYLHYPVLKTWPKSWLWWIFMNFYYENYQFSVRILSIMNFSVQSPFHIRHVFAWNIVKTKSVYEMFQQETFTFQK